ncbi:MAG TPA: hypothetical protein VKB68_12275 [Stellaceae bacterium]|nr:hypothetical protein [Stellaceae bacterium]
MVRRSTPARVTDERYFPVRVRVAVPPGGFGNTIDIMYGWLNLHAGRGNYAIHSAGNDLGVDAALFYFVDVGMAKAFIERFACGLALVELVPRRVSEL